MQTARERDLARRTASHLAGVPVTIHWRAPSNGWQGRAYKANGAYNIEVTPTLPTARLLNVLLHDL